LTRCDYSHPTPTSTPVSNARASSAVRPARGLRRSSGTGGRRLPDACVHGAGREAVGLSAPAQVVILTVKSELFELPIVTLVAVP
jgi:hypothetical protein